MREPGLGLNLVQPCRLHPPPARLPARLQPAVSAALCPCAPPAEKAVAELRKKGLAAASKKASRHAAEGLVGVAKSGSKAAVVEVRPLPCCELCGPMPEERAC